MFKSCGCQKIDKLMEKVIVLQLTPKVHKDPYLFISELRVIYFDIPVLLGENF